MEDFHEPQDSYKKKEEEEEEEEEDETKSELSELENIPEDGSQVVDHSNLMDPEDDDIKSASDSGSLVSSGSYELTLSSRKRKIGERKSKGKQAKRDLTEEQKAPIKVTGQTDAFFTKLLHVGPLGPTLGGLQLDGEEMFSEEVHAKRFDKVIDEIASKAKEPYRETAKRQAEMFKTFMRNFPCSRKYLQESGTWKFEGFKTTLYHFQAFCLGYMRSRELVSNDQPKGGFLMAPPGCGKTVMSLALVAACPPKRGKTLIIVPNSCKHQWWSEMEVHLEPDMFKSCIKFSKNFRTNMNDTKTLQSKRRIILVTYNQVLSDMKDLSKSQLYKIKWTRLIFDEGQMIKNHLGEASRACHMLQAGRRWILSGTLLINDPWRELYSYLTLLRIEDRDRMRFGKFKKCYQNDSEGVKKLADVKNYMIQIDKEDKFLGHPLFTIPPSSTVLFPIQLLPFEKIVLDILEQCYKELLIQELKLKNARKEDISTTVSQDSPDSQDTSSSQSSSQFCGVIEQNSKRSLTSLILGKFTRLRQFVDHWILTESTLRNVLSQDHIRHLEELSCEYDGLEKFNDNGRYVKKQRYALKHAQQTRPDECANLDELEATTFKLMEEPMLNDKAWGTGLAHGMTFNYAKYMKDLLEIPAEELNTLCVFCGEEGSSHKLAQCGEKQHFCHFACFQFQVSSKGRLPTCTVCHTKQNTVPVRLPNEQDTLSTATKGKKEKVETTNSWLSEIFESKSGIASSKTLTVKAQILNWLEEDPTAKIIVFSNFADMLSILGIMCQEEGWPYLIISGKMNADVRSEALGYFRDRHYKILLSTTNCGGTGLNLTCASAVLIIDPWFNASRDFQAFCRIHRIGQTKKTNLTILYTAKSTERYIQDMQIRKKQSIDEAMPSLSVADMLEYFGKLKIGEDGVILGFQEDDLEDEDN